MQQSWSLEDQSVYLINSAVDPESFYGACYVLDVGLLLPQRALHSHQPTLYAAL